MNWADAAGPAVKRGADGGVRLHSGAAMPQRSVWRARHVFHFLVWSLIWTSFWDSVGLLTGGDNWFVGPSYEVLRMISHQVGGMRAFGVPLGTVCLVLMVATTWSYGRHSAGRRQTRVFPICLSLLAGWYAVWSVGIVWANVNELVRTGNMIGWTSVSKLGFISAVAIRVACLAPPPPAPYGHSIDPATDGGNDREHPG